MLNVSASLRTVSTTNSVAASTVNATFTYFTRRAARAAVSLSSDESLRPLVIIGIQNVSNVKCVHSNWPTSDS